MEQEIAGFQATLARLMALFDSVPETMVDLKPSASDWSVRQIACHLVDSASNNHQRFTHLQRSQRLVFPPYEPDLYPEEAALVTKWMQLKLAIPMHFPPESGEGEKFVRAVKEQSPTTRALVMKYGEKIKYP